jgi:putative tricarboxylic transport membrane protein
VVAALGAKPAALVFGGGSVRGSLDHVVIAMAAAAAGLEPRSVRYLPYDGGGKAAIALLGAELDVLSSGVGESLGFLRGGDFRALAVSAPTRLASLPDVPTFTELGFDVVLANWRGVFGPPGLDPPAIAAHIARLESLVQSDVWAATCLRYGWQPLWLEDAAFSAFLAKESARLEGALTRLGFLR